MTGPDAHREDPATVYAEAVLDLVESIPKGRAMTYGLIAEIVGESLARGGPRQVGAVLARAERAVPWWRVVNASGHPPARELQRALAALRADGCPMKRDGLRVDLRRAIWFPEPPGAQVVGGLDDSSARQVRAVP